MVGKISRVTDFDFHHFNNNLSVVSSSESVIFIDNREPKQLTNRLPLLFGAKQTKFSPANEHLLFTSNVSDVRCFDIRVCFKKLILIEKCCRIQKLHVNNLLLQIMREQLLRWLLVPLIQTFW